MWSFWALSSFSLGFGLWTIGGGFFLGATPPLQDGLFPPCFTWSAPFFWLVFFHGQIGSSFLRFLFHPPAFFPGYFHPVCFPALFHFLPLFKTVHGCLIDPGTLPSPPYPPPRCSPIFPRFFPSDPSSVFWAFSFDPFSTLSNPDRPCLSFPFHFERSVSVSLSLLLALLGLPLVSAVWTRPAQLGLAISGGLPPPPPFPSLFRPPLLSLVFYPFSLLPGRGPWSTTVGGLFWQHSVVLHPPRALGFSLDRPYEVTLSPRVFFLVCAHLRQ